MTAAVWIFSKRLGNGVIDSVWCFEWFTWCFDFYFCFLFIDLFIFLTGVSWKAAVGWFGGSRNA